MITILGLTTVAGTDPTPLAGDQGGSMVATVVSGHMTGILLSQTIHGLIANILWSPPGDADHYQIPRMPPEGLSGQPRSRSSPSLTRWPHPHRSPTSTSLDIHSESPSPGDKGASFTARVLGEREI